MTNRRMSARFDVTQSAPGNGRSDPREARDDEIWHLIGKKVHKETSMNLETCE